MKIDLENARGRIPKLVRILIVYLWTHIFGAVCRKYYQEETPLKGSNLLKLRFAMLPSRSHGIFRKISLFKKFHSRGSKRINVDFN